MSSRQPAELEDTVAQEEAPVDVFFRCDLIGIRARRLERSLLELEAEAGRIRARLEELGV